MHKAPSPVARHQHLVAVVVIPGAPLFELAVPCEVFGIDRPELVDPWYELRLCTVEPGPVRVAAGFSVDPGVGLEGLVDADTVIVPACKDVDAAPDPALLDALK